MKKFRNFRNFVILGSIICLVVGSGISVLLSYGATNRVKDSMSVRSYSFTTGQVTCTTAGVKYAISVEAEVLSVKALSTNSGLIYVGDSTTATSAAGYELSAGESVDIGSKGTYFATGIIYVTSSINGDKVCWARLN